MKKEENIDKSYLKLMEKVMHHGNDRGDRTGTGTRAIFGEQLKHDMSLGFPLLTSKKMATKQIVTELIWLLRGETNILPLVNCNNNIWVGDALKKFNTYCRFKGYPQITRQAFIARIKNEPEFAKVHGELGPIYGKQWRDINGIDQLLNVIEEIKTNPYGRRHLVNSWNVQDLDKMTLPPCHYNYQFFVEEDKLSMLWNQRSCDLALGIPFNIASYGILLHIVAKLTGLGIGTLTGHLGDVHLYSNHIETAKMQIQNKTYPLCSIEFDESLDFNSLDSLLETLTYENYQAIKFVDYESNSKVEYKLSN